MRVTLAEIFHAARTATPAAKAIIFANNSLHGLISDHAIAHSDETHQQLKELIKDLLRAEKSYHDFCEHVRALVSQICTINAMPLLEQCFADFQKFQFFEHVRLFRHGVTLHQLSYRDPLELVIHQGLPGYMLDNMFFLSSTPELFHPPPPQFRSGPAWFNIKKIIVAPTTSSGQVLASQQQLHLPVGFFHNLKNVTDLDLSAVDLDVLPARCCLNGGFERVLLPATLKRLGSECFSGTKIKEIILPQTLKDIGFYCFRDCLHLTSVTFIMDATGQSKLKKIGSGAFQNCILLETIQLPDQHINLGAGVFLRSGLRTAPITAGQRWLSAQCFASCEFLEHVEIPTNIEWLGRGCFSNSGLKSVYIHPRKVADHDDWTESSSQEEPDLELRIEPTVCSRTELQIFDGKHVEFANYKSRWIAALPESLRVLRCSKRDVRKAVVISRIPRDKLKRTKLKALPFSILSRNTKADIVICDDSPTGNDKWRRNVFKLTGRPSFLPGKFIHLPVPCWFKRIFMLVCYGSRQSTRRHALKLQPLGGIPKELWVGILQQLCI